MSMLSNIIRFIMLISFGRCTIDPPIGISRFDLAQNGRYRIVDYDGQGSTKYYLTLSQDETSVSLSSTVTTNGNQFWTFVYQTFAFQNPIVTIEASHTSKYLARDPNDDNELYISNSAQQWKLFFQVPVKTEELYNIINNVNNRYLTDVNGGTTVNLQSTSDTGNNERWLIEPVDYLYTVWLDLDPEYFTEIYGFKVSLSSPFLWKIVNQMCINFEYTCQIDFVGPFSINGYANSVDNEWTITVIRPDDTNTTYSYGDTDIRNVNVPDGSTVRIFNEML